MGLIWGFRTRCYCKSGACKPKGGHPIPSNASSILPSAALCIVDPRTLPSQHPASLCLPSMKSFPSTYFEFLFGLNLACIAVPLGRQNQNLPLTQYGHNKCARFTLPQAEHLLKFVTSFNAFPAMNLCRFFLCEVFFFGTALSIDSHKPDKIDGIPRVKCVGIAIGKLKRDAEMSCWDVFQAVLDRTVGW